MIKVLVTLTVNGKMVTWHYNSISDMARNILFAIERGIIEEATINLGSQFQLVTIAKSPFGGWCKCCLDLDPLFS